MRFVKFSARVHDNAVGFILEKHATWKWHCTDRADLVCCGSIIVGLVGFGSGSFLLLLVLSLCVWSNSFARAIDMGTHQAKRINPNE